jgi:hypothetical protein
MPVSAEQHIVMLRQDARGVVMGRTPGSMLMLAVIASVGQPMLVGEALAYIDPGTTGLLSQILYVLFYGVLAAFIYFLRYIKQYVANAKQILLKLLGRD